MSSSPKSTTNEGAPLIAPTEEVWRAMSPAERERFLERVNDSLPTPERQMMEGRPHKKAKGQVVDTLGLHFSTLGRSVYLAEEMAVVYPGQEVFSPDVFAVLDVPQIEDDPRMAWVVADEGRGLDFVLEVLHKGDRKKDLETNVARYAQLQIPEYFVYDRLRQRLLGYRLVAPGARRYQRIIPQFGRHASTVLGLELGLTGNRLRFYYGMGELPGSADLIDRLHGMVAALETKADQAQVQVEQAQAQVEQAQAQVEQAQAEQALATLRESILAILEARQIPLSDADQARVLSCEDLTVLQGWLVRAATASAGDAVLGT